MARSTATDQWVTRILDHRFDASAGTARSGAAEQPDAAVAGGRESPPVIAGGLQFRKLMLLWRGAQSELAANMGDLGRMVLARPDVQADPRFPEVQKAVARLPDLIPIFSEELEDVLDRGLNAGPGAEGTGLAAEGVEAVDAYRQQLDGSPELAALEKLAADDLGVGIRLHRALDDALRELRVELARQAA